jgi:AAA family ATP:ADP antiporter
MAQAKLVEVRKLLHRVVDVRDDEIHAMLLAGSYFFFVLAGYYIIRPLRDEMAVAGGVPNLPWLFTGTLAVMLAANPLFAALVAKLPRVRFVSLTYRFFALNLLVFYLLLSFSSETQNIWIGRVFYVWASVFNLFVVSVFWAFMADTFRPGQGKRLFGFIAAGGTLGGLTASAFTAGLAEYLGPTNLLLAAVLLLEAAVQSMLRLSKATPLPAGRSTMESPPLAENPAYDPPFTSQTIRPGTREDPIGGSAFAGIRNLMKSSYLVGIAAYMLLFTITATFLYFQQAEIAESYFTSRPMRTAFFARIDVLVNLLTLIIQIFLAGKVIRLLGIGLTLALLPILCIVGFSALGVSGTLAVLIIFQALRRAANFALARPAREVLYTVLEREDKYKAKTLIDTFVYRAGDQIGAWSYAAMSAVGFRASQIAFSAVPLAIGWMIVALWLGAKQKRGAGN